MTHKNWSNTFFCIVLCCTTIAAYVPGSDTFGETEYDFGLLQEGSSVQCPLKIENPTNATLTVSKIQTSCSCTKPDLEGKVILPHSTLEFTLPVNAKGREGEREYQILICFKEINEPYKITLKGSVALRCPRTIDFGRVKVGEKASRKFLVREIKKIQSINYNHEALQMQWKKSRSNCEITVAIKDEIAQGNFSEQVEITAITNDGMEAQLHTVISGYAMKNIESKDHRLFFGYLSPDETATKKLELYSPYQKPISSISLAKNQDEFIDILDMTDIDNSSITLTLGLTCPHGSMGEEYESKSLKFISVVEGDTEETSIQVFYVRRPQNDFWEKDISGFLGSTSSGSLAKPVIYGDLFHVIKESNDAVEIVIAGLDGVTITATKLKLKIEKVMDRETTERNFNFPERIIETQYIYGQNFFFDKHDNAMSAGSKESGNGVPVAVIVDAADDSSRCILLKLEDEQHGKRGVAFLSFEK